MQKEIEIIKDGLSYNEELECIAKRFGMTQEQALKNIIHDIYISEVTLSEFKDAIVLIWDNNHDECVEFDIDGNVYNSMAALARELGVSAGGVRKQFQRSGFLRGKEIIKK